MNRTLKNLLIAAAIVITIILPVSLMSLRLFYTPFHVPTGAMTPSILIGDRFYSTTSLGEEKVTRGKVYIYQSPSDPKVIFVKRVVAVGGDRIKIVGLVLQLNGKPVARTPVDDLGTQELNDLMPKHKIYREKIEGVEYLTMWDENSPHSFPEVDVKLESDEVYFLGDNRSDSFDSRFYGPVKVSAIQGRPTFIWLSTGPNGIRSERFFKKVE